MTASEVVFDTWAWWEVFQGSPKGRSLEGRYLSKGRVRTSAFALAEIVARLASLGRADGVPAAIHRVRAAGEMVPVEPDIAIAAGLLRQELREIDPNASLADAVMLATARSLGLKLVSGDPAFLGQRDVVR